MSSKTLRFNAGKVHYDEETRRCAPLRHKGVVTIKPSSEEPDFLAFTWKPKSDFITGGTPVEKDELLLIPGDVSFKHIKSCQTGRVFALTFLSSGAKHLYWLQDVGDLDQPDLLTAKDLGIVNQINSLIVIKDDDEEEEEEEEETEAKPKQEEPTHEQLAPNTEAGPTQPVDTLTLLSQFPITSISDFLSLELVEAHLDKLDPDALKQLYSQHLPGSVSANPSRQDVLDTVRSGFFQQSEQRLSEQMRRGNGAGYLLSQSLKYEYKGEGIGAFLDGIRELSKKEDDDDAEEKPTD